jgi:serine/threonine-protein kinase RsbW
MEHDAFIQRFVLTSTGDDSRRAQDSLLEAIEQRQYDASCCFAIRLALEEALSNAFKHGNKNDPSKVVTVSCRIDRSRIEIDVEDEGDGFDPKAVPDPTEEENLEIPSGRGIVLMQSFMSEVSYEPPGNRVRMVFDRAAGDAAAAG